jgi:hypothetical protein
MVNHSLSLQHTLVLVCFPLFLTHVFNMLIIALLMPTLDMIKLSWTVLILTYNYVDSPPQRVLFPPFCIYSSHNWYFNMVPLPLQDSIGYWMKYFVPEWSSKCATFTILQLHSFLIQSFLVSPQIHLSICISFGVRITIPLLFFIITIFHWFYEYYLPFFINIPCYCMMDPVMHKKIITVRLVYPSLCWSEFISSLALLKFQWISINTISISSFGSFWQDSPENFSL